LKDYLFQKKMDIEFEEFDVVKLDEVLGHFLYGHQKD
jgi:hypothetical protein